MGLIALFLVIIFVLLLIANVPIAVAIGLSAWAATYANGTDANFMMASTMANGVNSFALLAIPFFILSGHLMGKGGMARRLIEFAASLVGMLPGGLAYVNVLTCMLFGSISGSAAAAVSSVGGFMIPEMNRKGYDREFNVAVTTAAATTGLLIPPSNVMIVYSVAAGSVSIAAMFMAGIIPGIISGLAIMLVCGYFSYSRKYKGGQKSSLQQIASTFYQAFWSLLLVIIVMGGILGGVFTPTEAAAISVAYSFILAVCCYREVKISELPEIFRQTGITTAVVMLLIGASSGMSWIMTIADIPQTVSAALMSISDNPIVILLTINLLLLMVGTFMDMTPAILIFTPIFLPVVQQFGMHPVHFGIMIIANLC
ncbi:MAG: TRAP transporter large permease, partial [Sedimentisphaerales bacterium]|nr:TRAP transporter large permease [Sedimentisphaerales bacterium]